VETLKQSYGIGRVLILDTDAHFGDGVHDIFLRDPSVLYISLHQDPRTLYPGRGFLDEIGEGPGKGYSVPVPLPPGSGDRTYAMVLEEILIPLAHEFAPDVILHVDGSDPHFSDRITQMGVTLKGLQEIGRIVGRVAGEVCGGKVVDFIGSGYSHDLDIVSWGWLASIAGVTGVELEIQEVVPPEVGDRGMAQARQVADAVAQKLSRFWSCFHG
jgi:acetoin utilization deacetylase AcuC-like enzyme